MKTLGDVIKIETGEQLNKSDMLPDAEHPVVNGGIDFSGYTDKYNSEANTITISQGGASAGYVNWLDQKFWAGAHCYVVTPLPNNDVRFLYHFIKSREYNFMKNQQGAGIPSLNRSEVYKTAFPDFDYNRQKEIAEILDSFTSMITNLETELASRQRQYEHYRNVLLTFDENDENLEWMTLGEISTKVCSGGTPSRGNKAYFEGHIPWLRTQEVDWCEVYDTELKITEEAVANSSAKIIPANCVIVAMYGATAGKSCINKIPLTTNQACCNLQINESIANYMYVYYFVCKEYENLKGMGEGSQNNINAQKIRSYKIPVPSLQRQDEIVSTLDTFESLIQNIKQELDARKKQYEYYREKLLTFE